MSKEKSLKLYQQIIVLLGCFTLVFAVVRAFFDLLSWEFILFSFFTITIGPRLNLKLPRSRVVLGFSDSLIFLSFLLFGGEEAIILAAGEMLAACLSLRTNGIRLNFNTLIYNISSSTLTTSLTYLGWLFISDKMGLSFIPTETSQLVTMLGVLSILQFITNSIFVSSYYSLKNETPLIKQWKQDGFSISITQIAGACIAGVTYKLITSGDYFATSISLVVIIFAYLNYRKVMGDMTSSIEEAEKAQQEKAESERIRAEQAEKYALELSKSLADQEIISEKLQESNIALEQTAFYDTLTKLPNRAYLIERLNLLLELGIDISNKYFVLFLDL